MKHPEHTYGGFIPAISERGMTIVYLLLQQQDGPEPEHDEPSFSHLPAALVVLFCKNAPPMSKIILDHQLDCSKSALKRKRVLQAAAPRAQIKARRVTTKRVQKEVVPSSLDQEASNIHQVQIRFLNSSFLIILLNRPAFFVGRHRERLQQGRANTSGKPEPGHPRESCGDG
jgi:hypothetical protein